MISCSLDPHGRARQRERGRRIAAGITRTHRCPDRLVVQFAPGFDRPALDELLTVERECCPFFDFAFDERRRRLTVSVLDPRDAPAIDAIAVMLAR